MTELAIRRPELPTAADMNAAALYAERLAQSGLLPSAYRKQPSNVLYAIEYGRMIGLAPMAAITGVHVIEGKPTASAALISALVRRAGHKLRVRGDVRSATVQIIRSDDPDYTFEVTYTIGDAQQAGLLNKQVWKNYPASMLKARAITQCARDACEEALLGMHYTPEELGAEVDEDGIPVVEAQQVEREQRHRPREDEWTQPPGPQIDDAEVVPEIDVEAYWSTDEGRRRLTALHALMGQKYGPMDDERRHAGFTKFTGRTVISAKQLTPDEVDRLSAALRKEADFQPAEEPQPDAAPVSAQDQADAIEARLRERIGAATETADIDAIVAQAREYVTVGQIGQVHLSEVQEAAQLRRLDLAQPVGASA